MSAVDVGAERLHNVGKGRMVGTGKTPGTGLVSGTEAVLREWSVLTVANPGGGAKGAWTFPSRTLAKGVDLVDFYHTAEQLQDSFDAACGADSGRSAAHFEKFHHVPRQRGNGVDGVIRALVYLGAKHTCAE